MPSLIRLFSIEFDFAFFGIPNLLVESRTSFYSWFILMVVIALALQALTNLFSGVLHLILNPPRSKA